MPAAVSVKKFVTSFVTKDALMLAASVLMVMAYAWLLSRATEPSLPTAEKVVKGVYWRTDGVLHEWREMRTLHPLEVARIAYALTSFEDRVSTLGAFDETPLLLIRTEPNVDKSSSILVSLSESKVTSAHEVARALSEAWLIQRGFDRVSLFRLQATADAVASLVMDENPENAHLRKWLSYAMPINKDSRALDPFSFKPLMRAWVLDVFRRTPPLHRLDLLEAWGKSLRQANLEPNEFQHAQTLPEWREWLHNEAEGIFPSKLIVSILPPKMRADFLEAVLEANVHSGLIEPVQVGLIFQMSGSRDFEPLNEREPVLLADKDSVLLSPSGVRFTREALKDVGARLLVLESCQPAKLADFLYYPAQAPHFLYMQSCGDENPKLTNAIVRDGLYGLAKFAPDMPFLQLNREQALFAESRGQMNRRALLTDYMEKKSSTNVSYMGLEAAEWHREVKAYRVNGPIEAVEWFRSAPSL